LLQLTAFVLLVLAVPPLLWSRFEPPNEVSVTELRTSGFSPSSELSKMKQQKPVWVLIGNSMLNTRIDPAQLSALSGVPTKKIGKGGSQSALWFLFLKKLVVESGARPALVTIFFRDTDLTWPEIRMSGMNEPLVKELEGHEQPEWKQVFEEAQVLEAGALGWIKHQLSPFLAPDELNATMRRQIQNRAFRATRLGTEAAGSERRMELNQRFGLEHLRTDLGSDFGGASSGSTAIASDPGVYEDGPMTFDPAPDASFLPHMLKLAKENGIVLHFHRIKRKPDADHLRRDLPAIDRYMDELTKYLTEQGCLLTDETDDPGLVLDMYVDGDHISSQEEIQKQYLTNFWARVGPVVTPVLKPSANASTPAP
jgi:hypothetical protein